MNQVAEAFQRSSARNPRVRALKGYAYYDAGNMQSRSKNYGVALDLLNKAISFGDEAMFYEERARINNYVGKDDEALKDINEAIKLAPQDPDLYALRSSILGRKEMFVEAARDIDLADRLKPNDAFVTQQKKWVVESRARAHYKRARALIDRKEMAPAAAELNQAIETDPNNISYYQLMDWLLAQRSDWDGISTGISSSP